MKVLEMSTTILLIINILLMFSVLVGGYFIYKQVIEKIIKGSQEGYKLMCTKSFPQRCVRVEDSQENFNVFDNEEDEMVNVMNDYRVAQEADRRLAQI